MYYSFLVLM